MSTLIKDTLNQTISWLPLILIGAICTINTSIAKEDTNSLPLKNIVRIEKGEGQIVKHVTLEPGPIPKELNDILPENKDISKPTKTQIKNLAEKNRLFEEWEVNPVLQFQDGDISYWYEQGKPAWNLELQFLARRIVIERAEEAKGKIPSQGDLSALSQPVFSWLYEEASKNWEKDKK
jgi:hypothetical protein